MKIRNIFLLYILRFAHSLLLGIWVKSGHGAHKKSCLNICLIFDFGPVRAVLRLSLGSRARKVQLCATKDEVQPSELPGNGKLR